jgi:hypothetical protein
LYASIEAFVAGKSLHVQDGVDADGVRVGASARADDHQLAPEVFLDERVELLEAPRRRGHFRHLDGGEVERDVGVAVGDEERELRARRFHGGDEDVGEPELLAVAARRFLGARRGGHRQRERELDAAVVLAVAVGADRLRLALHDRPSSAWRMGLQ